MESSMMKVVFSNIRNGSNRDLPSNETKSSSSKSAAMPENRFKPDVKYSGPIAAPEKYQERTSRQVFASIINASNCANLSDKIILDGYVTFASDGAFIKHSN